jgi:WD repeat-containing protein 48
MVLTQDDKHLITCSNDNTLMFWNTQEHRLVQTYKAHFDYVKCLSYASHTNQVASGGLDNCIYIWDVEKALAVNSFFPSKASVQKSSIYTLSMNQAGTLLVSGSTDKVLRVYDPTSGKKLFKLRGHQDNIRHVVVDANGNFIYYIYAFNRRKFCHFCKC